MRTPLRSGLAGRSISRLPEGPTPEERAAARFTIVCDVTRGSKPRRGVIRGADVYGLTAAAVASGAMIAARAGFPGAGGARSLPGVRSDAAS